MATTNLGLTELSGSQNQKYVTINEALEDLDNATQGSLAIAVAGDVSPTSAQFTGSFAFVLSGSPGAFTFNAPASKRLFGILNNTDAAATVQVTGGAGESVEVAAGDAGLCYSDGTDVYSVGGGGGGGGGSVAITDETIAVVAAASGIDFSGTGVSVTDDGDDTVTVLIPGLSDSPIRTGVFRAGSVKHAGSAQTISALTNTQVTFDTEVFDTTNFADLGTNNKRLTVPSGFGITKVRLHACIDTSTPSTGQVMLWVQKNSSDVVAFPGVGGLSSSTGSGSELVSYTSPPIEVTAGDYFDVWVNFGSAGSIDGTDGTYFAIEVLEDQSNTGPNGFAQNWSVPHRGAAAILTANNTAQDLSTFTDYPWDTTEYDTDNFWDGAQPSRLTIPAGVTKVRLAGSIQVTGGLNSNNATYMVIQKNGTANYQGNGRSSAQTGYNNQISTVTTGVIEVVEGDYFTYDIGIAGETNEEVQASSSYFSIEVVETTDAQERLFDVSTFIPGTPSAGAIVLQNVLTRSATLRATAPAAQGFASVVSTAAAEFDITKNGAVVGTVNFALGASTSTFTVASDVTFVAGDRVAIVAPDPADSTLADVSITLPIAIG